MLTRVDVLSENPFYLQIRDAKPTDSIIVEKIEGLDPPDIDLFIGDYARDGGYYSGRRVPRRQPIMTLRINPNYALGETTAGLRRLIYKAFANPFATTNGVQLLLHDDTLPDRYLTVYLEKAPAGIFDPGTPTIVLSFQAPNPYILDYVATVVAAAGPTVPFTYAGDVDAGFEINFTVTAATSIIKFALNGVEMNLTAGWLVGDQIYVDTRPGSRKIQLTRTVGGSPITYDVLFARVQTTPWLALHAPDNTLQAYGATSSTVVGNITQVRHRAMYWGI